MEEGRDLEEERQGRQKLWIVDVGFCKLLIVALRIVEIDIPERLDFPLYLLIRYLVRHIASGGVARAGLVKGRPALRREGIADAAVQ